MPAAQAVQAASKSYVDQSIQGLSQTMLAASGGTLSGPLTLTGDPTQPMQAADKHYVDEQVATAVPLTGGNMTGALTLNGDPAQTLQAADKNYVDTTATAAAAKAWPNLVLRADQFSGADFGAKLQACVSAINASYGGTCDARNFTGSQSMGSNLTISTGNTRVLLPCATITTANQIVVTAGTRNVSLQGCAQRGGTAASGSTGGTVFAYTGAGAMVQVGDPIYATDTPGFQMDDVAINTTSAASGAQGLAVYRTQELDLENLYLLGNQNQTGMTLDGTGNYTGGTFLDDQVSGFGTAVNAVGHQAANAATTDWVNASTFIRLHIDCPTSGGSPISGTYGINLQQGDGNTFTGGDVEGCATALHLGPNAQNNTIVGLRNENSTSQVVADAGSAYNDWMTGGTMFTGRLTDNGTRNSFLDTFHRSFSGLNGDWYGSQQDATVTNHYRLGTGTGNERGLLARYQTDYGYRWTTGLSDAAGGEQFYQVLDELNNVYRLSIGQYLSATPNVVTNVMVNNGGCYSTSATPTVAISGGGGSGATATANMTAATSTSCPGGYTVGSVTVTAGGSGYSTQPVVSFAGSNQTAAPNAIAEIATAGSSNDQTAVNAAGTGAVVLNGSNNAGTGGVVFGSGGPSETTVATISNAGNAQFKGTLQVGSTAQTTGTMTVRNNADAEVDYYLWPGLTASQKGSFTYKDWNGNSQWYMVKDASDNWALNSATGGLDSFKAYQSTNSGDSYIDSSNSTGHIRLNYEPGAGAETDLYSGPSASLDAAFQGPTSIKFPGLAAGSGHNCLQIDNSGYISNTGAACDTASGTVDLGNTGEIAYYTGDGTSLGGLSAVPLTEGGTGATTAAAAMANLLPGVTADGQSGIHVTGIVSDTATEPSGPPVLDIRSPAFAGGVVCDGTSDIGPAVQAALNSLAPDYGGVIRIIGSRTSPCYWANPNAITWPNNGIYTGTITFQVYGELKTGTTIDLSNGWTNRGSINFQGIGAANGAQFIGTGGAALIAGPSTWGTLGTPVTGATYNTPQQVTFTPSTMTGIYPGTFLSVADYVTCSIASISRTSAAHNNVTAVLTNPGTWPNECHIPAGVQVTISGVADSSYNGTFQVTGSDYGGSPTASVTLTWTQSGTAGSSLGGSAEGFNEDSKEDVEVTSTTGTTATATFYRTHSADAVWGIDTIAASNFSRIDHISVSGSGTDILFYNGYNSLMTNTGASASAANGDIANFPVSVVNWFWNYWSNDAFDAGAYVPWGLWITNSFSGSGNLAGLLFLKDSTITAGLKLDYGGGFTEFKNVVFEQPYRGGISYDPTYFLGTLPWTARIVADGGMQDNPLQQKASLFYQLYPVYPTYSGTPWVNSAYAIPSLNVQGFQTTSNYNAIVNDYFTGQISMRDSGRFVSFDSGLSTSSPKGILGNWYGERAADLDLRGEQAGIGPAVIPYATLNVPTNPSSWSPSSGCTLATGILAPDGTSTAGAFTCTGVGSSSPFYYSVTPERGDYILYGGWTYSSTPNTSDPGQYGPFSLSNFGSTDFLINGANGASSLPYDAQLLDDWWHPVVAEATVTYGDGTAGHIALYLQADINTQNFWMPFMIYIPVINTSSTVTSGSASVSVTVPSGATIYNGEMLAGTGYAGYFPANTQILSGCPATGCPAGAATLTLSNGALQSGTPTLGFQYPLAEINRWREQLLHGAVPANWNHPGMAVTPEPLSAGGFYVKGTALSTGNGLADWTNSGVANGDVPVWNSTTGKWTPGIAASGNVTGPSTSTSGDLAAFSGTNGTGIQDSGVAVSTIPQVVASAGPATTSSAIPATTFYTSPSGSTHLYMACVSGVTTAAGSSGTNAVQLLFAAQGVQNSALLNATTASQSVGSSGGSCVQISPDAGTPVQYAVSITSGSGEQYGVTLTLLK